MKKIFKSPICMFVLGLVLATCISVYAITASQVTYNDTPLDEVLDGVYSNLNSKMALNTFGTPVTNYSIGNANTDKTTTLTLNSGKYLLVAIHGNSYETGNTDHSTGNLNGIVAECTSGSCSTMQRLYGYHISTAGALHSNRAAKGQTWAYIYYVEVLENDTVISTTYHYSGSVTPKTDVGAHAVLSAIPINE